MGERLTRECIDSVLTLHLGDEDYKKAKRLLGWMWLVCIFQCRNRIPVNVSLDS